MADRSGSGSAAELDRAASEVATELPPDPPPPPPPDQQPEADAGETGAASDEGGLDEVIAQKLEEVAEDPDSVMNFTEEEIADFLDLGFGLMAEGRGPHWEISQRRARRIAKWAKKALDRSAKLPEWVKYYIPHLMALVLLGYEIRVRIVQDRKMVNTNVRSGTPPAAEKADVVEEVKA